MAGIEFTPEKELIPEMEGDVEVIFHVKLAGA
jgi:hypothetical protein